MRAPTGLIVGLMRAPTDAERERAVETLVRFARVPELAGGVVTFLGEGLTDARWRDLLAPFEIRGVEVRVPVCTHYEEPELVDACRWEISEALMNVETERYRAMAESYFEGDYERATRELAWITDDVLKDEWETRLTAGRPTLTPINGGS